MTRDELIRSLIDKQRHITYKDMSVAVKHLLSTMINALNNTQRIEVRDFGSFTVRKRQPILARNPRSGEKVMTSNRFSIHFKPGKELKERVNNAVQGD